jgi:hypothetical protein
MELMIEGARRTLIPIESFRQEWNLPPDFALVTFSPKDWEDLATMAGSREALAGVRERMVKAVPTKLMVPSLLTIVDILKEEFYHELSSANDKIGLRPSELDFAVAGFYDILQQVVHYLIRANYVSKGDSEQIRAGYDFAALYQEWLDGSTRLVMTEYEYPHEGATLTMRVIFYAYGRVGLEVRVGEQTYYVLDNALACPAANYMRGLTEAVGQEICNAMLRQLGGSQGEQRELPRTDTQRPL